MMISGRLIQHSHTLALPVSLAGPSLEPRLSVPDFV